MEGPPVGAILADNRRSSSILPADPGDRDFGSPAPDPPVRRFTGKSAAAWVHFKLEINFARSPMRPSSCRTDRWIAEIQEVRTVPTRLSNRSFRWFAIPDRAPWTLIRWAWRREQDMRRYMSASLEGGAWQGTNWVSSIIRHWNWLPVLKLRSAII